MEQLLHEKQQQTHIRLYQRYQRLTYVLAAVMLLLLLMLFKLIGHERTVLLPLQVESPFWVSQTQVSDSYLNEMTRTFAWLLLNTTPNIVGQQQATLLRYVHPKDYSSVKAKLDQDAEQIKRENITSTFYPSNQTIDSENLHVTLQGQLHLRAGQGEVIKQDNTYHLQYKYQQGRLWLAAFNKIEARS